MSYSVFKLMHLLGVVLLLGNIVVTAVWKLVADELNRRWIGWGIAATILLVVLCRASGKCLYAPDERRHCAGVCPVQRRNARVKDD